MSKTAIVIFSDPKSGSEEALGRLFNALFIAYELKQKNQYVEIVFQGTGTRWPGELVKADHPANALYKAVKDRVMAICGGCADVFGATDSATKTGHQLVRELNIPGTSGIVDLSKYLDDGYRLLLF